MRNLYADLLALTVRKLDNPLQRLDLRIFPQATVLRSNSTLGRDCSSFDHGKTRPSLDDPAQVGEMPSRLMAIFSRILAEW